MNESMHLQKKEKEQSVHQSIHVSIPSSIYPIEVNLRLEATSQCSWVALSGEALRSKYFMLAIGASQP